MFSAKLNYQLERVLIRTNASPTSHAKNPMQLLLEKKKKKKKKIMIT